jgi:hypothetical protein
MRTEYADLSTEKLDEAIRRYHKRYHEIKDDPKKDSELVYVVKTIIRFEEEYFRRTNENIFDRAS